MSEQPTRIFDLAERVSVPDPFTEVEQCREFDRTMRTQLIIPMQHLMKLLTPHVSQAAQVLEVGCGPGLVSLRLAALHKQAEFVAVDANDRFLEVARENAIFANLVSYGGRFTCDYAHSNHLPFDDDSFDVVFSFCAVPRWRRPEKTIAECTRVCRPGGTVVIYDLARDADEGMISFVLQYSAGEADQFMRSLRSGYTVPEMRELLTGLGLGDWSVAREGINLVVSSVPLGVNYAVGDPGIYEDIFTER
ncbi:class I SAM-dependent methyltransferase [Streptomyces sp. RY43-2]|uniref:Class I SAM-dependent methyltransferase n=1 Tax=Streptomyces macrolidinus TaxID=2952607 RepID=A0ABT0ZM26_9ACTN|nr:methyltransferase domain-containing protein [Streptomyces macrolidinus]MCN9244633.1 class I SAM-dependent methyltransferase [Streptomyces macrolidinus]